MKFQKKEHPKTLKISTDYHEHLKDVALYGIELFGERVSREFIAKIERKVARYRLCLMPTPKIVLLKTQRKKLIEAL